MPRKRRVLFVCMGNACRSPMAEGFARAYGSDVLEASSAGLRPATLVEPLTVKVMRAKNIALGHHVPTDIGMVSLNAFDLIVNMRGGVMPFAVPCQVVDWNVRDPIGASEKVYLQIRDEIETRVMQLILELRREAGQLAR